MICYIPGWIFYGSENVGTTRRWVVNFNHRQIYSRYSVQNGHYTEGLVGPTDGLDALEKGKLFLAGDRSTFLRRRTCSLVTTLTMFPRQLRKRSVFSEYTTSILFSILFFKEAVVNDLSEGQLAQDGKFRTLQVTSFLKQWLWKWNCVVFLSFLSLTNTKHVIFPFIPLSSMFRDKFNLFC